MKTMIAYASKSGAAKECADLLHQKLAMSQVFDLSKENVDLGTVDVDTIIIGSGVRMGKLYKPVLKFIKKNEDFLLSKQFAFYLCNAYPDSLQKAIEKNIPLKLINAAVCINSFGGKQPFTDSGNSDWILMDHVDILVSSVHESVYKKR